MDMPVQAEPMNRPSLDHTIWLEHKDAAFIYLPKVACTSWKLFFAQVLGVATQESVRYSDIHRHEIIRLPYVGQLPASDQDRFLRSLDTRKTRLYGVVREPRQRILSAYLDKIQNHANPHSYFSLQILPALQQHCSLSPPERPSFEQFLAWLAAGEAGKASRRMTSNDHWRPMNRLLGISVIPASGVWDHGKLWPMESLNEAVKYIQGLIGTNLPFPERQALGTRPSTGSAELVNSLFTPRAEVLFADLYATDLRLHASLLEDIPDRLRSDTGKPTLSWDPSMGTAKPPA